MPVVIRQAESLSGIGENFEDMIVNLVVVAAKQNCQEDGIESSHSIAPNDHGFLPAVKLRNFSGRAPLLIQFIYWRGQQGAGWQKTDVVCCFAFTV